MENSEQAVSPEDMQKIFKEISDNSREIHTRWEKEEAREIKIPAKLYHVTKRANVNQILAEGIDPSSLIFESKEVVSLSDDIPFALSVAERTQDVPAKDLVVLEIDTAYLTPSRIENYLRKADPDEPNALKAAAIHEVHYETNIPPEAIKVIQ